jgi:hypothetical protein
LGFPIESPSKLIPNGQVATPGCTESGILGKDPTGGSRRDSTGNLNGGWQCLWGFGCVEVKDDDEVCMKLNGNWVLRARRMLPKWVRANIEVKRDGLPSNLTNPWVTRHDHQNIKHIFSQNLCNYNQSWPVWMPCNKLKHSQARLFQNL